MNIPTSHSFVQQPVTPTASIARQGELLDNGKGESSLRGSSAQSPKLAGAQPLNQTGRGQIHQSCRLTRLSVFVE